VPPTATTIQNEHAKHTSMQSDASSIRSFIRGTIGGPDVIMVEDSGDRPATTVAALASKHALYGWNFVPLVTAELSLLCNLEILMLRRVDPGKLIQSSGDIDNRIKTLFDALQIPDAQSGVRRNDTRSR
jgi:hypothetical protein